MGRLIKFAAFALVIAAAFYVLPQGKRALDLNLAADDPARLTDLQLADRFGAKLAEREIAAALDRDDTELAESAIAGDAILARCREFRPRLPHRRDR